MPATGHNFTVSVTPSTCEEDGIRTYTCSSCNYIETETVPARGHIYVPTVKEPTCTTGGYTEYYCSGCSYAYKANEVAAKGHSYDTVVIPPTCELDGYTTYTCSDCGYSYVGDYVAPEHKYVTSVIPPDCTNDGYTAYTCTVCSSVFTTNKVSATGHSYSSVVVSATCDSAGYTIYTCTVCTHYYESDEVAALGHNWQAATTSMPKTCSRCGLTDGDKLPSGYGETLYVNYINVGQGDSILIKLGDCDILIDAGTASYGSTVSSYLKSKGVDDIELMINTHPDADHCGGLTTVLNNFVVEEVWISKDTSKNTAAYKNFIAAVSTEGLTAKKPNAGTVYTYEYLTLTVLYSAVGSDSNNSSIVVMLEYGSFKFLFTGDVGSEVESQLVGSVDLSCDVLKVGHHGSKYSSTAAFLSATGAQYGVICVGAGNSYGHPTTDALNRLSSAGISVYRTDQNGHVVFSSDGANLTLPGGGTVSGGSGTSGGSSGGSSSGGSSSGGTTSGTYYIGNSSSKVFHLPTCSRLPSASKQVILYDTTGYTPCGVCLKNAAVYIANKDTKVYHVSTCSYLPSASNRITITSTSGYKPCGHCIN